jgi:molecular chaperone GrpE
MIEEELQAETHSPPDGHDIPEVESVEGLAPETFPQNGDPESSESRSEDASSEKTKNAQEEAQTPTDESADTQFTSSGTVEGVDLQEAVMKLAQENEALRVQLDERSNQYMRIVADFDNFRKRTQKEKEELDLQVKRNTLSEILPVVDSFERARSQIKPQNDAEANIHKSYQGVYKQLVDCLKRIGVSPMRPEGKPFDPNLHEAVLREATDHHPEGTVLEEMMRGYLLGDRVLRHAMVKVASAPEYTESTEESEP